MFIVLKLREKPISWILIRFGVSHSFVHDETGSIFTGSIVKEERHSPPKIVSYLYSSLPGVLLTITNRYSRMPDCSAWRSWPGTRRSLHYNDL